MFGIENSKDRLKQLIDHYEKLKQDTLNVSLAESVCSYAWHLIDWVYEEEQEEGNSLSKESFREQIYDECPEMKILHDLVNTSKHKKISRPKVQIVKINIHGGAYSSAFSKAYDVSRLEIHFSDGSKIDLDDLIQKAIEFWKNRIG
jgi:hypothetical protein